MTVAIVGAGQAGGEAAIQLRQAGFTGRVLLFGEEPFLPYLRPPLSKTFLAGEATQDSLLTRAPRSYDNASVELHIGARVDRIDRHGRVLVLADGARHAYDRLIFATGGRPRRMKVPGAELANIFYLRTIADVEALRPAFQPGRRLVIVGGGYVGLEVASIAIKTGLAVTVLEGAPRVLARVTSPEMSQFYERFHRAKGVRIRTGISVSGFLAGPDGAVGQVECGEDAPVPADLVIVGIGLIPNIELAEAAGLVVDNGILVDGAAQSSDPHIHAIGDCAAHAQHGFLLRKVRLESVPNAMEQARAAAAAICGKPSPPALPPWFWSDQYDLKLQMVGLSDGYDTLVMRGDPAEAAFIALYLKDGAVIAADAVNRVGDFMAAKKLVAERRVVAPAVLRDAAVTLKSLAAAS